MARIFPDKISIEDVSRILAELSSLTPYSDDDWTTASFDFDTLEITINVKLTNGVFDSAARRCLELVIPLIPDFHAKVVKVMGSNDPSDGSDDHCLSWLDIEGDEVDLCYNCISYNSSWDYGFRCDQAGHWEQTSDH